MKKGMQNQLTNGISPRTVHKDTFRPLSLASIRAGMAMKIEIKISGTKANNPPLLEGVACIFSSLNILILGWFHAADSITALT